MKKLMLLIPFFFLITTATIAELTEADLQAIRAIVKQEVRQEIAASEVRTDLKLEKIHGEIAVLKTEITAINKRLGDMYKQFDGRFGFIQNLIVGSIVVMIALITAGITLSFKMADVLRGLSDMSQRLDDDIKDRQDDLVTIQTFVERIEAQTDIIQNFRAERQSPAD